MNTKVSKALNAQIKEELYSSYLYLAMAAYAGSKNLKGFQNWFTVQAKEELDHAMGFFSYLVDQGVSVELQALPKPPKDFKGPLAMFKAGLAHEKFITGKIHDLYTLATKEKDYAAISLLKWYVDEQVEEETNATEYIEKLMLAGEKGPGLFMLDAELTARKYTPTNPRGAS